MRTEMQSTRAEILGESAKSRPFDFHSSPLQFHMEIMYKAFIYRGQQQERVEQYAFCCYF